MQLDIVEGSGQNIIPASLQVGQTQTVTVVVENINNAPRNNLFSSVTVTLASQNGHFSVNPPNYYVGNLPTGTAIATWKITGISQGSDVLLISASARNTHENLQYSDSYSPSSSISVTPNLNPGSTPTTDPTPAPTDSPSQTANPSVSSTPAPTQTTPPNPANTKTPTPTPDLHASPSSTIQSSPNPASSTPEPGQDSETTPNPLNSPLLYIHPPLAITGYVLVFLFAILVFKNNYFERRITKTVGIFVWLFTFLGLLTGMLWAQLALGSYWSWDPKEIMTLILFLTVSAGQLLYFEKKNTATKWLALIACILVILTGLSGFIIA